MTRGDWSRGVLLAVGMIAVLLPGWSRAQAPVAKATIKAVPASLTAESILEKSITASGGKAALGNIRTMVQKASISRYEQKFTLNGTMETQVKYPGKVYIRQQLSINAQGNKIDILSEMGLENNQGWRREDGKLRDLTSLECDQLKEQTRLSEQLNWKERYTKADLIGVRQVDKKDAYALRLTPKTGKPVVMYYDAATFLLVRMDMMMETPNGTMPVESYYTDYRTIGGIKMAHQIRQRIANIEMTVKMTSIQVNSNVPDTQFAKPKS